MTSWRIFDPEATDEQLIETILDVYVDLYRRHFVGAFGINHRLPIEIRAFRSFEDWRILLLLTPWHLARFFFPKTPPELEIPPGWDSESRTLAPYEVIGPALSLPLLRSHERAHLNYHPKLGHYLLQPLIQALASYQDADSVFAAWDQVIQVRDRNIAEHRRRCDWQQEVSRRELLAGLLRRAKSQG